MSRPPKKRSWWKRTRRRIIVWLAQELGPPLLRLLAASWRVRRGGLEHWESAERDGKLPVFSIWHENIPAGSLLHAHQNLSVMISRHHDGEVITRIVERLGFQVARGSSFDGGLQAVREMLRIAESTRGLVITPDGPRGPRRELAPGVVFLAGATGRQLVASGFAASRAWRVRSWDRMMIPKPFARVAVAFAPPLQVARPEVRDPARLEWLRGELVRRMDQAEHLAQEVVAQWS